MKLWYTDTNDIVGNSKVLTTEDVDGGGELVVFENKIFCFYKSLSSKKILFRTKKANSSSSSYPWSDYDEITIFENDSFAIKPIVFKDTLFIMGSKKNHELQLGKYNNGTFSSVKSNITDYKNYYNPSFSILNNILYLFMKGNNDDKIWYFKSNDGINWTGLNEVHPSCESKIETSISPVSITYQGSIFLIFSPKDNTNATSWIKFDGEQWSSPTQFISVGYKHLPAATVHNGLLKVFFVGATNKVTDKNIYQYSYDGNCWSTPIRSTCLLAGDFVSVAPLNGVLYAVYPGAGS